MDKLPGTQHNVLDYCTALRPRHPSDIFLLFLFHTSLRWYYGVALVCDDGWRHWSWTAFSGENSNVLGMIFSSP